MFVNDNVWNLYVLLTKGIFNQGVLFAKTTGYSRNGFYTLISQFASWAPAGLIQLNCLLFRWVLDYIGSYLAIMNDGGSPANLTKIAHTVGNQFFLHVKFSQFSIRFKNDQTLLPLVQCTSQVHVWW